MQSVLTVMDIEGAVISADAMHCQTETTALIREGKADYSLQVKKNQGNLFKKIEAYFHKTYRDNLNLLEDNHFYEVDGEHGRINERTYSSLSITDWFNETKKFKDSFAVIEVKRKRSFKNKIEKETSYYITSLKDDVQTVAGYIRRHWVIENS